MSKWGVTAATATGPTIRGWGVNQPVSQGWSTGPQGRITGYDDPAPGAFRDKVAVCTWCGYDAATYLKVMQTLITAGVTWLRTDFDWSTIQPTSASLFSWASPDIIMTAAAKSRMNVLAILDYCAPWASSKGTQPGDITLFPPVRNSDYANFCAAVVARYGPGGTFWTLHPELVPSPLTAAELGNEPWGSWFALPQPDPSRFAGMALAAAVAIKAVNSSVQVIIPADLYQARSDGLTFQPWGPAVFTAAPTLATYTDKISFHPYPSNICPDPLDDGHNLDQGFYAKALIARDVVCATAGKLLPVWITEVGWTTATGTSNGVSEADAAIYTNHLLGRALQTNGESLPYRSAIEKVFIFGYKNSNGNMADAEGNYGIMHSDGTPKPAWAEILKYT